jgi:uncharacterized protein YebE (UPF0316 family)
MDVSLSTMRNIFLSKGFKRLVPVIGFFEVLIWLIVISTVMKNLNNWVCYFGWAGGFAMGTIVGMKIEERLALGLKVVRIITHLDSTQLIEELKKANHGVTIIDGKGANGPVKMLFTVVKRKEVKDIEAVISKYLDNAFYSVEDINNVKHGVFINSTSNFFKRMFGAV